LRPKGGVDYAALNGDSHSGPTTKRSRPPTSHQIALDQFRKDKVNYILDRGLRDTRSQAARKRKRASTVTRATKRCKTLKSGYDSEEEAHMTAAGRIGAAKMGVSMGGFRQITAEANDYGEEMAAIAQGLRRLRRRLGRLEDGDAPPRIKSKTRGKRGAMPVLADDDIMDLDEREDDDDEDDGRYGIRAGAGDDEWSDMSD
jgi:Ino eighty subunit 1